MQRITHVLNLDCTGRWFSIAFVLGTYLICILLLDYDGQPMSAARVIQIAPVSQPCFFN